MPDEKTKVVSLRLSEAAFERYSAEAAEKRISLGAYLRERLQGQEHGVLTELVALRQAIETMASRPSPHPDPPSPEPKPSSGSEPDSAKLFALALETVLLLRQQIANPRSIQTVHKELERLGVPAWR